MPIPVGLPIATPLRPLESRVASAGRLLRLVVPVPDWWATEASGGSTGQSSRNGGNVASTGVKLACTSCNSWAELVLAWRKAMQWRRGIEDVFCVMQAVGLSTDQTGDQLFLQVIGPAGSGKTRLCDAMLVSDQCFALEHLTGFHSGWKDEKGEDFSLISRINHKTLITPEGDVMMSSPRFVEIMSQQRRIFDGTSGAIYKNRKEDMRYTGLRTPWIIAGTPALMDTDQSRLGDRFLRVCMDIPSDEENQDILRRVGYTALQCVVLSSNGDARNQVSPEMAEAYQLTGGYVDWLRANSSDLLSSLVIDEDLVVSRCSTLAEFTAYLRARDNPYSRESHATKEMPTRLTHQYVRLACCMAVVMNRQEIDEKVLERVRKVAMDTSRGQTMIIASHLFGEVGGMEIRTLSMLTNHSDDQINRMLRFLRQIGVVEPFTHKPQPNLQGRTRWRLTTRMRRLYAQAVLGETDDA